MTDHLKRTDNAATSKDTQTPEQDLHTSESSYKTSHTAVRKARRFVLQGLYEWLMTDYRFLKDGQSEWRDNAPHDIAARTRATNAMHTVHLGYYHEMMQDIPQQIAELDALIAQHLDRDISKLDMVEHAILLIGAYELKNRIEVPYKVVLDEAMKLNNHFGATDAHKLINAVLDRLAYDLRTVEVQADGKQKPAPAIPSAPKSTPKAVPQAPKAAESDADTQTPASNKPRISAKKGAIKRERVTPTTDSSAQTNSDSND